MDFDLPEFSGFVHPLDLMDLDRSSYAPAGIQFPNLFFREDFARPFWDSKRRLVGYLTGRCRFILPTPSGPISAFATVGTGLDGVWVDNDVWKRFGFNAWKKNSVVETDIFLSLYNQRTEFVEGRSLGKTTHGLAVSTSVRRFKTNRSVDGHQILISAKMLKKIFDFQTFCVLGVGRLRPEYSFDPVEYSKAIDFQN